MHRFPKCPRRTFGIDRASTSTHSSLGSVLIVFAQTARVMAHAKPRTGSVKWTNNKNLKLYHVKGVVAREYHTR